MNEVEFLDYLCEKNVEMVCYAIQNRLMEPSFLSNSALPYACRHGLYDVVECLLTNERLDIGVHYHRPIRMAATFGYMDIVKLLMQYYDRSKVPEYVFMFGIYYNDVYVVEELIPYTSRLNILLNLYLAIDKKNVEIVNVMLQHIDLKDTQRCFLSYAMSKKKYNIVEILAHEYIRLNRKIPPKVKCEFLQFKMELQRNVGMVTSHVLPQDIQEHVKSFLI